MKRFTLILMLVGLSLWISCTTDEEKPKDFSSQADADVAVDLYGSFMTEVAVALALSSAEQAVSFDGAFDVPFKAQRGPNGLSKKLVFNKLTKVMGNGYNPNTGLWIFDTSYVGEGDLPVAVLNDMNRQVPRTNSAHFQVKFTPTNNPTGLPNENTEQMDYNFDYGWTGSESDQETTLTYDFRVNGNVSVTGAKNYRAGTGNSLLTGSSAYDFDFAFSSTNSSIKFKYHFDISYGSIEVAPNDDYPLESGSISFKLKSSSDAPGSDQYTFYISGKITFDGDNTAVLEFGGFTYTLNLDTGEIV